VWLRRAIEDLEVAKSLFETKHFADSCYHAQQAAEKAVKALLVTENAFIEGHKLSSWFRKVFSGKIENKKLMEMIKLLRELETHWVKPRYPLIKGKGIWDPLSEYTDDVAMDALNKSETLFKEISKLLKKRGVKL